MTDLYQKCWCEENPDHPPWYGNGACQECNAEMKQRIEELEVALEQIALDSANPTPAETWYASIAKAALKDKA